MFKCSRCGKDSYILSSPSGGTHGLSQFKCNRCRFSIDMMGRFREAIVPCPNCKRPCLEVVGAPLG